MPNPNETCPCGSGKRYRACCLKRDNHRKWANQLAIHWGFRLVLGFCIIILGMALFGQFHQLFLTGKVCTEIRGTHVNDCGPIAYIKLGLSTFSFSFIIYLLWYLR